MRIATSTVSDNIVRQIQKLGNQQSKLQTQVSTNQRIFQPEDDPSAVGRVLNLDTENRKIAQYTRNADRALQVSQASFGGLTALKKISDRMTEIGTLSTGAVSPESFQAYATEANQLIEQAVQLGNTRFGNDYIFAGTAVDTAPFNAARDVNGQITGVTYDGNTNQTAIALSDTANVAPGTDGTTNTGLKDFLNRLIALRDALQAKNPTAVTSAQSGLLSSEDMLVSALAEHGGIEMRIQVNQSEQEARGEDIGRLISNEVDSDLPSTIVKLSQTQVAYQAALQSASNIMKTSLLDFLK